ncbi:MAG: hypothetical protein RQ736_05110 [Thiogranum sp.]|nr:hypothetical protein [Thiogranum sp.]
MKTTLYIFSLLWFVAGLVLLALAATLEPMVWLQLLQPPPVTPDAELHPVFGNYATFMTLVAVFIWVLVFCVPALLLLSVGAILGRLDAIDSARAVTPVRPPPAPPKKRAPTEKVEPHIGRV